MVAKAAAKAAARVAARSNDWTFLSNLSAPASGKPGVANVRHSAPAGLRRRQHLRNYDHRFPKHKSSADRALQHWLTDLLATARVGPITNAYEQTVFERREAG